MQTAYRPMFSPLARALMATPVVGFCLLVLFTAITKKPTGNYTVEVTGIESPHPDAPPIEAADGQRDLSSPVFSGPKLEVQSWTWSRKSDAFTEVVGEVRNIANVSLNNVAVVATFYDKKGGVITTEETLIDYQPILPGQTSPFKVITTYNPAMEKAGLDFKELMGGTIMFRDKSRKWFSSGALSSPKNPEYSEVEYSGFSAAKRQQV